MAYLEYIQGSDLPDAAFTWKTSSGSIIDFTSAYTFVLKIGVPGQAALITKSTGFTGAATAPNLTVAWSTSNELNTLAVGVYSGQLKATRNSDSKDRFLPFEIKILPAIS